MQFRQLHLFVVWEGGSAIPASPRDATSGMFTPRRRARGVKVLVPEWIGSPHQAFAVPALCVQ